MIYYVVGTRHDCFVKAKTPQKAVEIAKHHVDPSWEHPEVYEAKWIKGVLEPKDEPPVYRFSSTQVNKK